MSFDERRLKTASRIAAAIFALDAFGTCRSSLGRDDPDFVVGGLEADAGSADVVNDDRVEFLPRELVAPVGERAVAVLGGEADDQLAVAAALGERGEHVRSTDETQVQFPAGLILLELAGVRVLAAGSRRRPRPSAARRTRRSARRRRRRARRRCATSTYSIPGGRWIDTLAATTVTLAPRRWASSASASPMRPDERLPTKRTESIGSRVPPAVTSTCAPSSSPPTLQRRSRPRRAAPAARAAGRCRTRPASRARPVPGSSTVTPRARRRREVGLGGRMLVHRVVHGRSDDQRSPAGQRGGGQQVVRARRDASLPIV